jgi:hypothetical protein
MNCNSLHKRPLGEKMIQKTGKWLLDTDYEY